MSFLRVVRTVPLLTRPLSRCFGTSFTSKALTKNTDMVSAVDSKLISAKGFPSEDINKILPSWHNTDPALLEVLGPEKYDRTIFKDPKKVSKRLNAVLMAEFGQKLNQKYISKVVMDNENSKEQETLDWIDQSASFQELGLDSLDRVEMIVYIEREFHIEMKDEELEAEGRGFRNVGDIVHFLANFPECWWDEEVEYC